MPDILRVNPITNIYVRLAQGIYGILRRDNIYPDYEKREIWVMAQIITSIILLDYELRSTKRKKYTLYEQEKNVSKINNNRFYHNLSTLKINEESIKDLINEMQLSFRASSLISSRRNIEQAIKKYAGKSASELRKIRFQKLYEVGATDGHI